MPYLSKTVKKNTPQIQRLWGKQKEIIRLSASGLYTNKEIAEIVGVTPQTVSNIINSELGQSQIEILQGMRDAEAVDVSIMIKKLAPIALSIQQELMLSPDEKSELKSRIADSILDRAGHVPISKGVQLTVGLTSKDIAEIKARAEELQMEVKAIERSAS